MNRRDLLDWVRERFVLTRQEKKMVAFVAAMFLLGLATMEYRRRNPPPPPPPIVQPPPKPKKASTPRPKKPKVSPVPAPRVVPAAD
ncbi:MAG: hypothetical protein H0V56_12870 [Chthoniobacterales bacterium]|nr:hypothetical protein [Chthoniobacterales bacterium]